MRQFLKALISPLEQAIKGNHRVPFPYFLYSFQYILEVRPRWHPGGTSFNPWDAFVAMELGEDFIFPTTTASFSCTEILHPGVGKISAIHGVHEVRKHPAMREFRLKVKAGDTIGKREGAGHDIGYLLHTSESPTARLELHHYFRKKFVIDLE